MIEKCTGAWLVLIPCTFLHIMILTLILLSLAVGVAMMALVLVVVMGLITLCDCGLSFEMVGMALSPGVVAMSL